MLGETRVHSDFSNFSINENEVLLEKLSFSGTTLSTKEVVVEFSDNLTSIIGGREQANLVLQDSWSMSLKGSRT